MHWSHWWFLESARYLDLRAHVQGPPAPDGRTVVLRAPLAPSRNIVRDRVLPRLLDIARTERSDDMVSSALVAIGRLTDPSDAELPLAIAALRARLSAPNMLVRESALLGLGLLGDPEAAEILASVLSGDEEALSALGLEVSPARLRAFAAHALGFSAQRMDDARSRQRVALALVEALEGDPHRRDDVAVAALGSLGLVDLGPRSIIPREDIREREAIGHVLSGRALARYVDGWIDRSVGQRAGHTVRSRAFACVAYARIADDAGEDVRTDAVERLVDVAEDRALHMHVRTSATIGLGEVARGGGADADRRAREFLVAGLRGGQPLERRFSRIALASSSIRPGGGDDGLSGWTKARTALTGELARARSSDLAWTALALGILEGGVREAGIEAGPGTTSALSTMAVRRKSDDDSAALGLGIALAARGGPRADAMGNRVADELDATTSPVMRGHLAIALGLLERSESIDLLRDELAEARNQPILLWSVAVSLVLLGEPVDDDLVDALRESNSSAQRIAITAALGQTGTASAVEPLLALLAEDDRPTPLRASVVDSLAAICDLDRLPWRDPIAHALPYFAATPTLNGSGSGLLERPW
ncbi:MAG: hypothetical protein AAF726_10135 [Planctomycetota bacterium]